MPAGRNSLGPWSGRACHDSSPCCGPATGRQAPRRRLRRVRQRRVPTTWPRSPRCRRHTASPRCDRRFEQPKPSRCVRPHHDGAPAQACTDASAARTPADHARSSMVTIRHSADSAATRGRRCPARLRASELVVRIVHTRQTPDRRVCPALRHPVPTQASPPGKPRAAPDRPSTPSAHDVAGTTT